MNSLNNSHASSLSLAVSSLLSISLTKFLIILPTCFRHLFFFMFELLVVKNEIFLFTSLEIVNGCIVCLYFFKYYVVIYSSWILQYGWASVLMWCLCVFMRVLELKDIEKRIKENKLRACVRSRTWIWNLFSFLKKFFLLILFLLLLLLLFCFKLIY